MSQEREVDVEQREQPDSAPASPSGPADEPSPGSPRVEAAIARWQRELLDLSRNNRLLYFQAGRGRRGQGGVPIAQPTPPELFDRLANREKRQTISRPSTDQQLTIELALDTGSPPHPTMGPLNPHGPNPLPEGEGAGSSPLPCEGEGAGVGAPGAGGRGSLKRDEIWLDVEPERLDALLYRLRLRARSALLEQGIDILYVAFGLLEWTGTGSTAADERALSPLLLLPVLLDRARSVDPYTLTPLDERPVLNPALAYQLQHTYQLTLTLPQTDDDGDLDYQAALAHLRDQLSVRPDWSVRDGAYLGLFSFAKQAMYADLAAIRDRLVQHPVVRALAGEPECLPAVTLPEADRLDEREHPRETFQVLDADASQRTVLGAIRAGSNLVVQGPPGTGKSQTIANAIAEALAHGKSVLFVSEKLAALQVVAKRLRAAGLGDFCLEAHGHGGDKAAIVKALAAALPEVPQRPVGPSTEDLQLLAERRDALNAYARALHNADNPLGASAFAIHGELAKRAAAPRILFDLPSIAMLTGERVIRMVDLVRRLEPVAAVVTAPEQHPWHGCIVPRWNPLVQAQLETTLSRLARAADELAEVQARAVRRWGLSCEPSVAGAVWLVQVLTILDGRPPALARWLTRPTVTDLVEQVRSWRSRCDGYSQRRQRLLVGYRESVFELDLPPIIATLEGVELGTIERLRGDGPAADRALAARPAVKRAASRTLRAVPATLTSAADLAEQLGMAAPTTRAEMARVLQVAELIQADPRPEAGWLEPGRLGVLADLVAEAARQSERAAASRAALAERFDDAVLSAITPALAERFETTYGSWLRYLRPDWYADVGLLRRHLRAERAAEGLDYSAAADAIRHWREVTAAESWLAVQSANLAKAFGRHYLGNRTDWIGIQGAIDVVRRLTELFSDLRRWPRVSALLLEADGAATLSRPIQHLRTAFAELDAALTELNRVADFDPSSQPPLPELAAELEGWLAALAPLWEASDALHGARRQTTTSVADLLAEARDALACPTFEREFGAAMPGLVDEFGPFFKGLSTDWARIVAALGWTAHLRASFDRQPPDTFMAALDAEPAGPVPERDDLARALARVQELREELGSAFRDGTPRIGSHTVDRATLPALAAWARSRHAALPRLQEWIDTQALLGELASAGLRGFVDGLIREAPPPGLCVDAFLRQLFTLWLTWRYERAPALARFRRPEHEQTVADLRHLDRRQWELNAQRISATLLARRPGRAGGGMNGSEIGLLLREARKQRRFKPLRRLFAELPHLLPRLKPCLLMSPLSVAQHLGDSAVTFDLVIFDEASQILPADAIGAIGRARQVGVVGDRRQLPPTRFFQVTTLDTIGDDPDEEPPESVLDACLNAGLAECSLLWHYRSRHEHLIAFSNGAFYDGRLRTFPSPDADERVVTFEHVPGGVYDRGGARANHVEAVKVADLVVEHVEQQASVPAEQRLSLGVIAFSEAQMLAILGELEARKRARPDLEPLLTDEGDEGLFVKNLESVQGDERDVILFSIGYGRDAAGRLTMSFGPLNAPGGERRLNVAVTRARRRLTVVASIRAHEIDGGPERPAGVRQLKRYLEYAENGPSVLLGEAGHPGGVAAGRAASPFEAAVQAAITAALGEGGPEVVAGVGVGEQPVDLAVRDHDGRYLLAIECDGRTFASLPTARDRDRLRQEVLERLGWQVHRIWSTDWIGAQRDEEQRVLVAVERARLIRDGLLPDDTPLSVLKSADQPARGVTRPQTRLRVSGARIEGRAGRERMMDAGATDAGAMNCAPTGPDPVGAQFIAPADAATAPPTPDVPDPQAWTENVVPSPSEGGGAGGGGHPARPIEKVPETEIVEAVRAVLSRAFAMPAPELEVAVARELGYQRTGARIRAVVGRVVGQLLQDGTLVDSGGNLRLSSPS
ncbi:MAG TPA: DUF4011 domain-containing protein [Chloroflexota bacterium]|nr:DUF4011 domain-containing protein [Chloroflexota bacterium]